MDIQDIKVLEILQSDNRTSAGQIAEKIGLSVSAVGERIRRLNATGIIDHNRAIIDPHSISLGLCAYMFVDLGPSASDEAFVSAIEAIPEVLEAHHITGKHSWLIKLRVKDTAALQTLLTYHLKPIEGVQATESIIVLETAKETTELPLHVHKSLLGGT